jgi:hypothetical protein
VPLSLLLITPYASLPNLRLAACKLLASLVAAIRQGLGQAPPS